MLDFSIIRNYLKNIDTVETNHLVVAEWNMNKYIPIKEYGLYKNDGSQNTYTPNDSNEVLSGENYLVYDDGSKEVDPSQEYFSNLSSVFRPNRPDPGIVFLQKFGSMTFAPIAGELKAGLIATNRPRYYLVSENNRYQYFNSAKLLDKAPLPPFSENFDRYDGAVWGVSNAQSGKISSVNPFVVYDHPTDSTEWGNWEGIDCNKITIKIQNHLSVPKKFNIEVLIGTTWEVAYSSSSESDFEDGILNIHYKNSAWSKTESYLDNILEIDHNSPQHIKRIKGIKLKVEEMTIVSGVNQSRTIVNSPASLELIEISPRLQVDVTDYTESFSFDNSLGDSTNFGLPVGSIVSGAGQITLSNEDKQFLLFSKLGELKMLNEDVEFRFYQKIKISSSIYTIPLKVLYSNQWNIGEDYSVSVDLEDGMKLLRETKASDLLFPLNTPMSTIILFLLDNAGITGLEFKKTSDLAESDKEDIRIKNFFCKKEQTVAEVLEEIAIATQCSMYYDAVGRLNVLTKERLTQNADISQSSGPADEEQKTDFWFVGDENFTAEDKEFLYLSGSYTANIASISEEKINPLTDGEVTYRTYGPEKDPLLQSLQGNNDKTNIFKLLDQDQIPLPSLAFSNYGYSSTILWSPEESIEKVLGAANISIDIPTTTPKSIFTGKYEASDEDNLVRILYQNNKSSRNSMVIYLDVNEGLTIAPYEGTILVDNEYIKFRGKLFYVASTNPLFNGFRIIFSQDEFAQLIANIRKGDSISFRGLMVKIDSKIVEKVDQKYNYKIIGDGRGSLSSKVAEHSSLAENSDGIDPTKTFKIMLGSNKNKSSRMPGKIKASTKFNYLDKIRYKSAKKTLGSIPKEGLTSYLGFLHVSGPMAPKQETEIVNSALNPKKNNNVIGLLNNMNKQVDDDVPGNFDDYIYLKGEKNIYGQKIELNFSPNAISTRMRLYSPRRLIRGGKEIMSTNSSIAGIGFGLNDNNEGYFLEVESAGSGKNFANQKQAYLRNLRFYKVKLKTSEKGKTQYVPQLLLSAPVGSFNVYDTSIEIIKNDNIDIDPVFDLDILISRFGNGMKYTIYYADQEIGTYTEPIGEAIGVNSRNIFFFVRNDSQAIYEYVMAAARPYNVITRRNEKKYFNSYKNFNGQLEKGIIPVNKNFIFTNKNKDVKFYFNDFARLAREVKEYDIRFEVPAFSSALLDISKINPKYFVKSYTPTAFGAKLTIVNSSGGAVTLGQSTDLPLFIVGVAAQEINSGVVSLKSLQDIIEDDKKRQTDREKNISIYGEQTFNLESQYIQSISQARNIIRWVSRYCNRQRMKLSLDVFPNPLIELGDKVKVFDKSRGYYEDNIGPKTFVVSSISHSVDSSGPSMNIELVEVGES